jgi:rubrerythrin
MANQKLLSALKMAYEAEKQGLKTYLEYAKKTEVGAGKDMFIQLALDEVDHMELIENFSAEIAEGKPFHKIEVPAGRIAQFKPDVDKATLNKLQKSTLNDEEALKVALEHEKNAENMYEKLAQEEENPEVRAFFEEMAKVEEKHYQIIQAELNFMRQEGFWFDTTEFSVESN